MASNQYNYWDCYYQQPATSGVTHGVRGRHVANEKERGRVQTVNTAFTQLRTMIPTDPADRKLSKVETLRLAASYISHLNSVLMVGSTDNQPCSRHRPRQNRTVCTFCISGHKSRSYKRPAEGSAAEFRTKAQFDTGFNYNQNTSSCYSNNQPMNEEWMTSYSTNQNVAQWLALQDSLNSDVI